MLRAVGGTNVNITPSTISQERRRRSDVRQAYSKSRPITVFNFIHFNSL
jgi:hypothetical protein